MSDFVTSYLERAIEMTHKIDKKLSRSYPFLKATSDLEGKDSICMALPDIKFLPDGEENITSITVYGIFGSRGKMTIWSDRINKMISLSYNAVKYKIRNVKKFHGPLVLKLKIVEDVERIVETNNGIIDVTENKAIKGKLEFEWKNSLCVCRGG